MTIGLARRSLTAALMTLAMLGAAQAQRPVARFTDFRYDGREPAYDGRPATPGTYLNPVIAGSYADPSIVRVGADYYLANSSFALFPGIPIFHSRDLVHWRQIGAAINRPSQMSLAGRDTWEGLYAPDLKYHDGRFYLLGTCYGCGGNFIMTARDPAGPWSDPVWLPFEGIDPSIFFDPDGSAYVVNNGPPSGGPRYDGHRAIWAQRIDLATNRLISPRTMLVDRGADPAAKPFWIEGPHIFRRGEFYYLICAEGGTKEAHREVVFRSRALLGPYEAAPAPILSQLGLDPRRPYPVVQAGHADFVTTPAGAWWAVFLASRPHGPGELDYNIGRETFLLPVAWRDGWPAVLPSGAPIPYRGIAPALRAVRPAGTPTGGDYVFADGFRGPALDRRWNWLRMPAENWWVRGGTLALTASGDGLGSRGRISFAGIRQAHRQATIQVTVRFAPGGVEDAAGLALYQDERRYFTLAVTGESNGERAIRLVRRAGPNDPPAGVSRAVAKLPDRAGAVRLRIRIEGAAARFNYKLPGGRWMEIGSAEDAGILSIARAGGFSGVMVGPFAVATR